MHRAVAVIVTTAGGLALLAGFHTNPGSAPALAGGATGTTVAVPPSTTSPPTVPASTTKPPAGAGPQPAPNSVTTFVPPTTTTTVVRTTSTTARATTVPVQTTRTIDGPVASNDYGDVQVRLTLDGSHITDVQALVLPSDRRRSQEISNFAGPRLRTEVLQAQSANINLISGASYTSESYAESVQGALDRA